MKRSGSSWALRHSRWVRAGMLLLVVLLAGLTALGVQTWHEYNSMRALELQTQREADSLNARTLGGRAMGAVMLAGQLDPVVQEASRASRVLRDVNGEKLRDVLETLARGVDADGAFVVNGDGLVVGLWDNGERRHLGQNLHHQPYVQMAREAVENVYASVSSSGAERSFYLAAPIYSEQGNASAVSGVLVLRMLMTPVDRALSVAADQALLISPQGVVFSASRTDWLFAMAGSPDAERMGRLARSGQYGRLFGGERAPQRLPFNPAGGVLLVDGQRMLAAQAPLQWNDVDGAWRVVLMRSTAVPWLQLGVAAGVVGLLSALLLMAVWRAWRHEAARRDAVAEQAATAERMAERAAWQTRLAELGARLQVTRDVGTLADCFFQGLSELLPLHQASLYAAGEPLRLLAEFGGSGAPAEIAVGEGLLGECARNRQPLWLQSPPEGYWRVHSALAAGSPRALVVLPVQRSDKLIAVLELAALREDLLAQRETLDALLPVLALNLEAALPRH